jgi:hypothetical protein
VLVKVVLLKTNQQMNSNNYFLKKTAAVVLLVFPAIMMLAFVMHFSSFHSFFNFRLSRDVYDAGKLFDVLVGARGHGFIMAHFVAVISVPLFFMTMMILGSLLYPDKPLMATIGVIIGVVGCTAMAAVFGAWLSFTGIATVDKSDYAGARIAFIELVRMKGALKIFTSLSNLCFISIVILATGLIWAKKFDLWRMLCIIVGAILFIIFMDMDNWMFIGSFLLLLGFMLISRKLRNV